MALGDGIRRDLSTVDKAERDLLRDAILQLNKKFYAIRHNTDPPVSYWFKQDEIHDSGHVHGCPAFLPWHREMCNRFETLLREINPKLSLHYWNWNTDPSNMPDGKGNFINLFDADFMGNADANINNGNPGEPLLSAGFYKPNAGHNNRDATNLFSDPPLSIPRAKSSGLPQQLPQPFGWSWPSDVDIINASTWEELNNLIMGVETGKAFTGAHACAHYYIGGIQNDMHRAFRDPFVFFLHANIDRLWAMWQHQNPAVRLDPNQVYGTQTNSTGSGTVASTVPNWGILSPLEPWSGPTAQTTATGIIPDVVPVHPWKTGSPQIVYKDSRHTSIVNPPLYDTTVPQKRPKTLQHIHDAANLIKLWLQIHGGDPGPEKLNKAAKEKSRAATIHTIQALAKCLENTKVEKEIKKTLQTIVTKTVRH